MKMIHLVVTASFLLCTSFLVPVHSSVPAPLKNNLVKEEQKEPNLVEITKNMTPEEKKTFFEKRKQKIKERGTQIKKYFDEANKHPASK